MKTLLISFYLHEFNDLSPCTSYWNSDCSEIFIWWLFIFYHGQNIFHPSSNLSIYIQNLKYYFWTFVFARYISLYEITGRFLTTLIYHQQYIPKKYFYFASQINKKLSIVWYIGNGKTTKTLHRQRQDNTLMSTIKMNTS